MSGRITALPLRGAVGDGGNAGPHPARLASPDPSLAFAGNRTLQPLWPRRDLASD